MCKSSEAIEDNYGGHASLPTACVLCYVREDKAAETFAPLSVSEVSSIKGTIKGADRAYVKYLSNGLSHVESGKSEYILCESYLEDRFSNTIIDTALTRFEEQRILITKKIYEKMAYKGVFHSSRMRKHLIQSLMNSSWFVNCIFVLKSIAEITSTHAVA